MFKPALPHTRAHTHAHTCMHAHTCTHTHAPCRGWVMTRCTNPSHCSLGGTDEGLWSAVPENSGMSPKGPFLLPKSWISSNKGCSKPHSHPGLRPLPNFGEQSQTDSVECFTRSRLIAGVEVRDPHSRRRGQVLPSAWVPSLPAGGGQRGPMGAPRQGPDMHWLSRFASREPVLALCPAGSTPQPHSCPGQTPRDRVWSGWAVTCATGRAERSKGCTSPLSSQESRLPVGEGPVPLSLAPIGGEDKSAGPPSPLWTAPKHQDQLLSRGL